MVLLLGSTGSSSSSPRNAWHVTSASQQQEQQTPMLQGFNISLSVLLGLLVLLTIAVLKQCLWQQLR